MSLPRLDFSTLTHNAAKWPLPGKALLGCALAGLVLVVGDSLLLAPSRERQRALGAQEMALQQQLVEKTGLSASLEERTRQLQLNQAGVAELLRQLPSESEVPGLLEDIARLAVANGLMVESIAVLDEQIRPYYVEQPMQIGASGAFHDLVTFVNALGGLARIVTVHDVALRRDGALLRLELLAKIYRSASLGDKSGYAAKQGSGFVYDPSSLRDPFQLPALQAEHLGGQPALAPDLTRPRGLLEGLAVDQFEMVGTLSRGVQSFALLRVASTVHRLAVGDYVGPNHGRVTAIHDGHIELAELFPDEQGAWLVRSRTLVLNVNS
ncbi:pilus assembly protein PilP [Pseudomonas costantinii]|uniref:Pilus assembly protein n=1 Tax=Pseudomonas costantinii TaxID=168469 RepID=A0A1S2VAG8_9PSED|nr:pilus assembly protein PilP [Pseudomonas costantinii]OIN54622.1 pilus assembly protein [Pseudomonas costantinii]OIN54749.1 pilus assembly protein [Pseudomonas costantinii]OIN55325.1 pilus assembly protein [Pseudomonas costantinii]SEE08669.1 type IV pilus assembly protein PilO [Pseudomonas costantinii]